MTFAELKAGVESAVGRTDIPDYVYQHATASIDRTLRTRHQEKVATVSISGGKAPLPSDYLSMVAVWNGDRTKQVHPLGQSSAGSWSWYVISWRDIEFSSDISGATIVYHASLPGLSANSDTNVALDNWPDLYHHLSVHHAALWAMDGDLARSSLEAADMIAARIMREDAYSRFGGNIGARATTGISF